MVLTMMLALSLTHAWRLLLTQQNTGALSLDSGGCLEFMDFSMFLMVGGTTCHLLFLILRGNGRDTFRFGGAATLLLAATLALSMFHALKTLLMRGNVTARAFYV